MNTFNKRLLPAPLEKVLAPFGGAYQKLGSPLPEAPRIIKFTNNSDADVLISWDGVTDNEILPAGSFVLLDVAANKEQTNTLYIAKGTQIWIKATAGTPGATKGVFMSVYYA